MLRVRNQVLLREAMEGEVGTLVVFLLKYETTRGRFNEKIVAELEQYLVESALDRNPSLKNRVYANPADGFSIPGMHRSRGRPSKPASELRRALAL